VNAKRLRDQQKYSDLDHGEVLWPGDDA